MIQINERLSEFSFGYGVVEETRRLLQLVGWNAVPFLPSLLHENEIGFDVAFHEPGAVLMLQFKLGEELRRFHRSRPNQPIPALARPFWRFQVHTGEQQFLRLWSSEVLGALVYYVAPRFANWSAYERYFLNGVILDNSLLITPAAIRQAAPGPAAKHRVLYDAARNYVCSEPIETPDIRSKDLVARIAERLARGEAPLAHTIKGLSEKLREPRRRLRRPLPRHVDLLRGRARTPVEEDAAVVALEAWMQGTQLVFVGSSPSGEGGARG